MITPRDYQQLAYEAGLEHARSSQEPCILELGTAAGKSIIVAMLAQTVCRANKRVLVICPNGDLVSQNSQKYRDIGEKCSIYSAKLGKKHTGYPVVFATPISVANNLDDFGNEYALLIIDEAHNVSEDENTSYQKIIKHLKEKNKNLRIIGLTATPVRYKTKLVNHDTTFKHIAYKMQSYELAQLGWTVPFLLGISADGYHLEGLQAKGNGKFKQSEVDEATLNKERLTRSIVNDVVGLMDRQNRKCCIFFASSIKHGEEILSYLPPGKAAIIDGNTTQTDRERILNEARKGGWRYLVNVGTLTTGTDLPIVDTIALLRATEAIALLLQILGRGCRLYCPSWLSSYGQMNRLAKQYEGKMDCLVLDYGNNIERFNLDDDLTIAGLLAHKEKKDDDDDFFAVACPDCGTENRHTSQRCIGVLHDNTRCEYRFVSKECNHCQAPNSPSARHCWKCDGEIIDPNKKLSRNPAIAAGIPFYVGVIEMNLKEHYKGESQSLRVTYKVTDGDKTWEISEYFKANNYGFSKFMAQTGGIANSVELAVAAAKTLNVPTRLMVKKKKGSKYFDVISRYFDGDSQNQLDSESNTIENEAIEQMEV